MKVCLESVKIIQAIKNYSLLLWIKSQFERQYMSEIQLQDRIKMAHTIEVESATRRKLGLKISWYDVHGENHTQEYSLSEGSRIEF